MNKQLLDEVNKITKGILVYAIVISIILALVGYFTKDMITGLLFGSIISALNLRLLGIAIEKSVTIHSKKAQVYLASQYSIRMAIVAVVLFSSAMADHINIIGVVIGLLSTKFVILINKLIIEKFRRKEA